MRGSRTLNTTPTASSADILYFSMRIHESRSRAPSWFLLGCQSSVCPAEEPRVRLVAATHPGGILRDQQTDAGCLRPVCPSVCSGELTFSGGKKPKESHRNSETFNHDFSFLCFSSSPPPRELLSFLFLLLHQNFFLFPFSLSTLKNIDTHTNSR